MKIVLKEGQKVLQTMLEMASKLNTEAKLNVSESGVHMVVTDYGNAGLRFNIDKSKFESIEGSGSYGIELKPVITCLKKMKGQITIEESGSRIVISSGKDKLMIPIVDDVKGYDTLPNYEFKPTYTITLAELSAILDKLGMVGGDAYKFYAEGDTIKAMAFNSMKKFVTDVAKVNDGESAEGDVYVAPNYLAVIAANSQDKINVYLKKDYIFAAEHNGEGVKFIYLVAPRTGDVF